MSDSWNPDQYHRFRQDRARPFHDLLALLQPTSTAVADNCRVLDLGCGTGELTIQAHHDLGATSTLGIDSSAAMLDDAQQLSVPGVRFEMGDLRRISRLERELPAESVGDQRIYGRPGFDVILANASLQWVPDHAAVLADWRSHLRPGGQLAVQVPTNYDHVSHTTITEVLAEDPFAGSVDPDALPDQAASVLAPEQYAELLWSLGATDQSVRVQVYGMQMESWTDVVEWTKGTALVRVRNVLPQELYDQFVRRYSERLGELLGHRAPYYYPFKRLLMWARFD